MNWRRLPVAALATALFTALALSGAVNSPAAATDFQVLSPSASDFPQHVDWVTVCHVTKTANEDPIVFPGVTPTPHNHTFSGNTTVNTSSTAPQLVDRPTNCTNSGDTASYWMPTLLVNGKPVTPYMTRAYYRAGTRDTSKLHTIPFGLEMVAGDAMATKAQSAAVAGFQCRIAGQGPTVTKQALPPQCGSTALLEASVVFPNCWDGTNLDSTDHKSHMAYAKNYVCDAAHPVQLPQLTLAERFTPGTTSGTLTLAAMNSPLTLHADFLNAWKPSALAQLMTHCIYAHVFCEDVSDRRMPPGMTTTVPAGSTSTVASTPTTTSTAATPSPAGTAVDPQATSTSTTPAPTSSVSGAVIKSSQASETKLTVAGSGFPAHVPAKIVATSGSATRSVRCEVGHDGTFTAELTIPASWAGSLTVTASANSGKVKARTTIQLH
jgi:hypothetical protein